MIDESSYRSESLDIRSGDRFVLYTDGLVEIGLDKADWMELRERLLGVAESVRALPLDELPAALVKAMGADAPEDDVAVLAVEV
jgi:serine phosphatase RsbU (regulator of sigma subunit)